MTFLLIFYSLFLHGNVLAGPLQCLHATCESSFYPREIDCNKFTQRTEWNIVWSCFATIFACSWISVHPDIPAPSDSSTRIFIRRLMIMACTLIAPEMLIVWAARQWYAAHDIVKRNKDRGWTTTHGFFASMGGFMLYKDGVMTENLTIEKLESLVAEGRIDWPTISEKDIQDRSKGDSFSKGFAVLQTTWFISQCISRGITGLILTELELVTLAFSVLNAILYFLWWNKPLGVSRPVPIHLCRPTSSNIAVPSSNPETGMPATDLEYGETDQDISSLTPNYSPKLEPLVFAYPVSTDSSLLHHPTTSDTTQLSPNQVAGMPTTGLEYGGTPDQDKHGQNNGFAISIPFQCNPSAFARFRAYICEELEDKGLFALIVIFIKKPFQIVWFPVVCLFFDNRHYSHPGSLSIPTFYAPPSSREGRARSIGTGFGILFSGIHGIAWSFRFQSAAEQYIWRISAVNITVLPIIQGGPRIAKIAQGSIIFAVSYYCHTCHTLIPYIVYYLAVYWLSRVALLILPLLALRSLPPEALLELKWTAFIPHI
ncbi:hypothetical protein BYT27DRAFT_7172357 [Phlegmacium glaucopus]|nr:hypothetical protein BYT27DRAFT_7172357 [Phlegmacium glaucopus]